MSTEPYPRRVLMTADTVGGVWTFALELARGLSARDCRVCLATMGAPLSPNQWREAGEVPGLSVRESRYRLEWMPEPWEDVEQAGEWLLEVAREIRPDVVHLNGYAHASLQWPAPVLVTGHSCVLSWWQAVHGESAPPEWGRYRAAVQLGLQSADYVTAPTRSMLEALSAHYGSVRAARVIHNGRDARSFPALEKEPFVLAAGRCGDRAKNLRTLAEAAEGLAWPVRVAGAERDPSGAEPFPVGVEALGMLDSAAMARSMGRASIYCLPTLYEPFGLSILEAALAGCALVLGDIPSLRELWSDAALFVSPNDARALREQLRMLIENPPRRAELAAGARVRALSYSSDRCVEGYLSLYRELLSGVREAALLS